MNRVPNFAFHAAVAAIILFFGVCQLQAQGPGSPSGASPSKVGEQAQTPAAPEKESDEEESRNPFAPEPAAPLPPGMTGSNVNDPRATLAPGLYDAGEAAMGMKHLLLL